MGGSSREQSTSCGVPESAPTAAEISYSAQYNGLTSEKGHTNFKLDNDMLILYD